MSYIVFYRFLCLRYEICLPKVEKIFIHFEKSKFNTKLSASFSFYIYLLSLQFYC